MSDRTTGDVRPRDPKRREQMRVLGCGINGSGGLGKMPRRRNRRNIGIAADGIPIDGYGEWNLPVDAIDVNRLVIVHARLCAAGLSQFVHRALLGCPR